MIEEAAIDGVPVIVIDPKGDLTNLLLTFPEPASGRFAPWINEDEARRAGKSPAEFAADAGRLWKHGLAEWGEDGARIQRLRDAAEFTLYTPGSTAGVPVSVLTSLERPASGDDPELLARTGADDGVERARARRCLSRTAQEPRAHPALDDPAVGVAGWRKPGSCVARSSASSIRRSRASA